MDGTLFGWWITAYARQMLEERLVSIDQLIDAILRPDEKQTFVGGAVYWGPSMGVAWRVRAHPETSEVIHTIETVLLRGPDQVTWEDEAPYLSLDHSEDMTVVDLIQGTPVPRKGKGPERMAVVPKASTTAKASRTPRASTASRRPGRKQRSQRSFPVEVRNIFDGVPEAVMKEARRQLEAMGRNPDDLSQLRPVGKSVEILE